jgi:outer membrane protein assembly factor BamA
VANVSARTGAFNALYEGIWTEVLGPWDVLADLEARTPKNIRNFFGLGNERPNDRESSQFYQASFSRYEAGVQLGRKLGERSRVRIGPFWQITDIGDEQNRFLKQPEAGVSAASFDDQSYAGLAFALRADARDHPVYPRHGARWDLTAKWYRGLNGSGTNYADFRASGRLFTTLLDHTTLGVRLGAGHNHGAFPFFGAQTLGGRRNLRGWRSTRFAGRTALYQNVDLRIRLARFSSFLAVGEAGMLLFGDNGRVWTDGETSRTWHQGGGFGLWTNLFNLAVVSTSVGFSPEQATFDISLGFQY